jgi:short-subunit dehydrogenase
VLNAGFGTRGPLARHDRAREVEQVRLNCVAVVDLAAHALPGLVERGRGALVVVSSAAAFQPLPYMATYAATKAFERSLAGSLAEEVRGTGVRVLAVLPGPTETEFSLVAGRSPGSGGIRLDRAGDVAARALDALERGRREVATGPVARLAAAAAAVLPRRVVVWGAGQAWRLAASRAARTPRLKGSRGRP